MHLAIWIEPIRLRVITTYAARLSIPVASTKIVIALFFIYLSNYYCTTVVFICSRLFFDIVSQDHVILQKLQHKK